MADYVGFYEIHPEPIEGERLKASWERLQKVCRQKNLIGPIWITLDMMMTFDGFYPRIYGYTSDYAHGI